MQAPLSYYKREQTSGAYIWSSILPLWFDYSSDTTAWQARGFSRMILTAAFTFLRADPACFSYSLKAGLLTHELLALLSYQSHSCILLTYI